MLNGKLALHDIRDLEAFTATHLRRHNRTGDEDLHAYTLEELWILSTRYNGTRGSRFSSWAQHQLPRIIIQYDRNHADTRYQNGRLKRAAQHIPLDDQLDRAHPTRTLDDPAHRDPDLHRLHRTRDRSHDRPYPTLDRSTTRTTP